MAKKSTASLSVVPSKPVDARLSAPKSLTGRQAELWGGIVSSKPASWFDCSTSPLLVGYVKAIASHEALALRSDALESVLEDGSMDDLKTLNRVHAMLDRQARLIQTFATKLRLTNQARYSAASAAVAAGKASGTRPWDEPK